MYVGEHLRLVREHTSNSSFSEDTSTGAVLEGISDRLILTYMNDALQFLQSRIINVYEFAFVEEDIQNVVADQEEYSISDNLFLTNRIVSVEYSRSGALQDYYPLSPVTIQERKTRSGDPFQYIRRKKKVLINYIPSNAFGKLRINYQRAIDKLYTRIGQLTSATTTSIVLDNDSYYDELACERTQHLCIVDQYGTVKDYNVVVTSFNDSTRTFTIPTTTLSGTTGDFVVPGKYVSTHLQDDMPDRAWDYIRGFASYRIYHKDSNTDAFNEKPETKMLLDDIVDAFSQMSDDHHGIPIIDYELQ